MNIMSASTAIVLHELETDQPVDHRLQDVVDVTTAQANPATFASTEDMVVLETGAHNTASDGEQVVDESVDFLDSAEAASLGLVTMRLTLDGDTHLEVPGLSLARISAWFARALLCSGFKESSTHAFEFRGNPHVNPSAVRLLVSWLDDRAVLDSVSDGSEFVSALRLASYWEVPTLLRSVEERLVVLVERANALPLLQLADETGAYALYAAATAAAVDGLDELSSAAADGSPSEWEAIPTATREFLRERRRLRDAARSLGLHDDALPDAREFVALLREATQQQRERCEEADEWAERSEGQLGRKLAQRVARGEISQKAADAIFERDTAKPRAALRAQRGRVEAEMRRLQAGVTASIIDGWLAARRLPAGSTGR